MDYKKIFKTPEAREIVLNMVRFIPDKLMLRIQYWIKMGRVMHLRKPERFTEKLQWYKLNYKNPIMSKCVDKYTVREYIKEKNLEEILVKLYAKYNSIDEVEWDTLPNQFVIKTTNGGGGANVVVCKDKNQLDVNTLKRNLRSKAIKPRTGGREWAYYGLKPGIVVEELLINSERPEAGINDYKFFCYSGKAKYVVVDIDRYIGHKRNFYDIQWNNLQITSDCPACDREIPKPENLEKMIKIAEKLSEGFPYVRVDLYDVDGKVYFGELTFYPWSAYVQFIPDEADYVLGKDFELIKMR